MCFQNVSQKLLYYIMFPDYISCLFLNWKDISSSQIYFSHKCCMVLQYMETDYLEDQRVMQVASFQEMPTRQENVYSL